MGALTSSPACPSPGWRTSVGPNEQAEPKPKDRAEDLEEFRKQLAEKRELRRKLIADKSKEMQSLRRQLDEERRLRSEGINENKQLMSLLAENNIKVPGGQERRAELDEESDAILRSLEASLNELQAKVGSLKDQNRALQCEVSQCHLDNAETAKESSLLSRENLELRKHVQSLKDVNRVSKEMINIRERQLEQMKEKLSDIERSLADRETRILSDDLRGEYERQLENIRNLRVLYEERARLAEVTRLNLVRDLEQQKSMTEFQEKKCGELESRVAELEKEISDKNDILGSKENQLGVSKAEARDLQAEMSVINQLFSQLLLGFNNNQDLDKLVSKLEENHDLLTDMVVREDCSEVSSALPKLILDLLNQVDKSERDEAAESEEASTVSEEPSSSQEPVTSSAKCLTSAEEIVGNLPKVWRVLMELLSHQAGPPLVISDISEKSTSNCYNSVETPYGTRLVPSVSKTYIRLKDLILEKKALQKEMNRLKQLNGHLDNRLQDQERRLGLVSSELNKTWHIVGRMQRQHQQLHTQEQILRFELQEKRILLTELKEELQYCKENWDKAKQKNSESQEEWNKLRQEFSSRKAQSSDSVNNSPESGYSDEKPSDDDSDDSTEEKKADKRRMRKKSKIENVDPVCDVSQDNSDVEAISRSSDSIRDETSNQNIVTPDNIIPNEELSASSSTSVPEESSKPSYDDVLAARSVRLKKLEEQCAVLVHKVTKTNTKGIHLCNRLEELHNQYSRSEDEPGPSNPCITENEPDPLNQCNTEDEPGSSNPCITENEPDPSSSCTTEACDNLEDIPNVDLGEEASPVHVNTDRTIEDCDSNIDDNVNKAEKDTIVDHVNIETDNTPTTSTSKFDYEARFAARDERLKRMEEDAKSLVAKVSNTSTRSVEISSKLTELHNTFGRGDEETGSELKQDKSEEVVDVADGEKSVEKDSTDEQQKDDNAEE